MARCSAAQEWRNETAANLAGPLHFQVWQGGYPSRVKRGKKTTLRPKRSVGPARMVPAHDGMPDLRVSGSPPGLIRVSLKPEGPPAPAHDIGLLSSDVISCRQHSNITGSTAKSREFFH
jgi:hypothetical protein